MQNVSTQDIQMCDDDKLGLNLNADYNDSESKSSRAAIAENFIPSSLPIHDPIRLGINAHFQFLNDHAKTDILRASDLLVSVSAYADVYKTKIIDLALAASEELILMAQEREPLWLFDIDKGSEVLNVAEYKRRFASQLDPALEEIIKLITGEPSDDLPNLNENIECQSGNGCRSSYTTTKMDSEASRATGVVFRNPITIVNLLMDVDKWSAIFSNIVSKALNLAVLSPAKQENPNGALQVMVAEFHGPCPLIKSRKMYFVRYSRQIDMSTWVVADVSLETILPSPSPELTCQRKPSGCLIQALQDGLSAVTWVEHNAVFDGVVHHMSRGQLTSGSAFSAKRWISSLERQYDRIATLEAKDNDSLTGYLLTNKEGIGVARFNGLLKLAERMMRHFNSSICSNMESGWRALPVPGAEQVLIKTSFNMDDPQMPPGVAVTIVTSVWLPANHNDVFNFLQTHHNRNKWDILSDGLEIQDIIRISSARKSTDCVSVVSVEESSSRTAMTYLQESFNDSTTHYVVYAPVDVPTMDHILQGGSTDSVAILPSGFAVVPDDGSSTENTILTIAFQVMDQQPTPPQEPSPRSLFTAYKLITQTVSRIRTALLPKI